MDSLKTFHSRRTYLYVRIHIDEDNFSKKRRILLLGGRNGGTTRLPSSSVEGVELGVTGQNGDVRAPYGNEKFQDFVPSSRMLLAPNQSTAASDLWFELSAHHPSCSGRS